MIAKDTTFATKDTRFVTAEKFHDKLRFVKNKQNKEAKSSPHQEIKFYCVKLDFSFGKTRRMYEREKAENEQ